MDLTGGREIGGKGGVFKAKSIGGQEQAFDDGG